MGETFDDAGTMLERRGPAYARHLIVCLECDRPLAGTARHSLRDVQRVIVGRGDARISERSQEHGIATLSVRIPGRSMSAAHARLVRVGAEWVIEDTGSKNGTFVNGERVERAVLADDDIVELGHTLFRVTAEVATRIDAPLDRDVAIRSGDVHATLHSDLAEHLEALWRLSSSNVPVLLLGESGTGKEVLARAVHARADRKGALIAVNCGAIPVSLVESQLFGHVKGAFSGAVRDEPGLVRAASGGTLFLDEIADLPPASQAALLRVLQEREVIPLGATRPIKVDVRVIAATHQPLEAMVARGDFRRDLYARLAGFTIDLPPLRARRDDLGILVAALLPKVAASPPSSITFTSEAGLALVRYDWPLNIRELEQCLAMSTALAENGRIERAHLPPNVARALEPRPSSPSIPSGLTARDSRLRLELLGHLAAHAGNLADVARTMGKARMQVHRWCGRFGIDPNVYRR